MIEKARRKRAWAVGACLATLALAGCGANGTSSVFVPPNTQTGPPAISGTIYAPDGQFAAPVWWRPWVDGLSLSARAYAILPGESHITSVEDVSLSRLDPIAAAHGCEFSPPPCTDPIVGGDTRSDPATGTYQIVNGVVTDEALAVNSPASLIVLVGPQALLTRAFVLSRTTNIDAVTEAVVRLVLNRLPQAPAISLSTFTVGGLQYLDCRARAIAEGVGVSGVSVADINDAAYSTLAASPTIQQAMDCITGIQSSCMASGSCPATF